MSIAVETAGAGHDASLADGASAFSPLTVTVFGFVLLILLQAWFVRRITRLTASHRERQNTYRKLAAEAADLAEEVVGLDRARDANTASIAGLERETQELQERIDTFVAEHGHQDVAPATPKWAATDEEQNATSSGAAELSVASEDS